jgi:hypothetical protein
VEAASPATVDRFLRAIKLSTDVENEGRDGGAWRKVPAGRLRDPIGQPKRKESPSEVRYGQDLFNHQYSSHTA